MAPRIEQRIEAIERRLADVASREDVERLRASVDSLELAVLDVTRWQRDSVAVDEPVLAPATSLAPARKAAVQWVAVALLALASGIGTALVQRCSYDQAAKPQVLDDNVARGR